MPVIPDQFNSLSNTFLCNLDYVVHLLGKINYGFILLNRKF